MAKALRLVISEWDQYVEFSEESAGVVDRTV